MTQTPADIAVNMSTLSYDRPAANADGTMIALVLQGRPRRPGRPPPCAAPAALQGCSLRVVAADGGAVLFQSKDGPAFSPAWSPDGRSLAFLEEWRDQVRLCILAVEEGTLVHHPLPVRVTSLPPVWMPDGGVIVTAWGAEALAQPDTAASPTVAVHTVNDPPAALASAAAGKDRPCFIVEVRPEGGTKRLTAADDESFWPFAALPSAGGGLLAVASELVWDVSLGGVSTSLRVVERSSGAVLRQVDNVLLGDDLINAPLPFAWHPSADSLFLFTRDGISRLAADTDFAPAPLCAPPAGHRIDVSRVMIAADGSWLAAALEAEDGSRSILAAACGAGDGGIPALRRIPAPAGLSFAGFITGHGYIAPPAPPHRGLCVCRPAAGPAAEHETVLAHLEIRTGAVEERRRFPGTCRIHAAPGVPHHLLVQRESLNSPPGLYLLGDSAKDLSLLCTVDPLLRNLPASRATVFRTELPEPLHGRTHLRTAVILPAEAGPDSGRPIIATFYGGYDASVLTDTFGGGDIAGLPAWLFTAMGFAVVLLDMPLGPEGQPSDPLDDLRTAAHAQLEALHRIPGVDTDNITLIGHSYGAYGVAGVVSDPSGKRIRAAVAIAGGYDLPSVYGWLFKEFSNFGMVWAEQWQGRMGSPLWDDPQRYIRNSPYWQANLFRSPLLLVHGRGDETTPWQESGKMFNALRRLGRTVELAVYENQGHRIADWTPDAAADAIHRIVSFLSRPPETTW